MKMFPASWRSVMLLGGERISAESVVGLAVRGAAVPLFGSKMKPKIARKMLSDVRCMLPRKPVVLRL